MTYLLDTNICIWYLRGKTTLLGDYLRNGLGNDICLCAPVVAELLIGAEKSQHRDKHLPVTQNFIKAFPILPFDEHAAIIYVEKYLHLSRKGQSIHDFDLQIASIALANSLTVVTHNLKHFNEVPGLQTADWQR